MDRIRSWFTLVMAMLNLHSVSVYGRVPTIYPPYSPLYVVNDEPLNMTCTVVGYTLDWRKGDKKVMDLGFTITQKMDVDLSGKPTTLSSIRAERISESDSGEYRCISDSGDTASVEVKYVIVHRPDVFYDKTKMPQQPAILVCNTTYLRPAATQHWEFKGKRLDEGEKYSFDPDTTHLVIRKPVPEDGGPYMCVISYTDNKQVIKLPVNFYVPPTIRKPVQHQDSTVGDDQLTLRCEVYSWPRASIHWTKDGQSLDTTERIMLMTDETTGQENGLLKINSVNQTDQGNYVCEANVVLNKEKALGTVHVNVRDSPPVSHANAVMPFMYLVPYLFLLTVTVSGDYV